MRELYCGRCLLVCLFICLRDDAIGGDYQVLLYFLSAVSLWCVTAGFTCWSFELIIFLNAMWCICFIVCICWIICDPFLVWVGHERFGAMTRVYYKFAIAAVICFDISRPSTLDNVKKWRDDITDKVVLPDGSPIPMILLANKVGLFIRLCICLCICLLSNSSKLMHKLNRLIFVLITICNSVICQILRSIKPRWPVSPRRTDLWPGSRRVPKPITISIMRSGRWWVTF